MKFVLSSRDSLFPPEETKPCVVDILQIEKKNKSISQEGIVMMWDGHKDGSGWYGFTEKSGDVEENTCR
jgi:hypothetical protein